MRSRDRQRSSLEASTTARNSQRLPIRILRLGYTRHHLDYLLHHTAPRMSFPINQAIWEIRSKARKEPTVDSISDNLSKCTLSISYHDHPDSEPIADVLEGLMAIETADCFMGVSMFSISGNIDSKMSDTFALGCKSSRPNLKFSLR